MTDYSDFSIHNPTFEELQKDKKAYTNSIGKYPFTTRNYITHFNPSIKSKD